MDAGKKAGTSCARSHAQATSVVPVPDGGQATWAIPVEAGQELRSSQASVFHAISTRIYARVIIAIACQKRRWYQGYTLNHLFGC